MYSPVTAVQAAYPVPSEIGRFYAGLYALDREPISSLVHDVLLQFARGNQIKIFVWTRFALDSSWSLWNTWDIFGHEFLRITRASFIEAVERCTK